MRGHLLKPKIFVSAMVVLTTILITILALLPVVITIDTEGTLGIGVRTVAANPDASSYRDEFNSLGTDRWGTSVNSSGTVAATGGKLTITTSSGTDAAIAYLKTKVDQTKRQLYRVMYATTSNLHNTSDRVYLIRLYNPSSSEPAVEAYNATKMRVEVFVNRNAIGTFGLYARYRGSDDLIYYWNPTTNIWTTTVISIETLSSLDEYYTILETQNGAFRFMVVNSAYTRWIFITDWVDWSDLDTPSSDLYLTIGCPFTDSNLYKGKLEVEAFEYYGSRMSIGYFNGRALASPDPYYGIYRCNIYREDFGVVAVPWRAPIITNDMVSNWLYDWSTQKTVTATGEATWSELYKKFERSSSEFDGVGDYLSLVDSADWDFGTGDFTIDFWIKRYGTQTNSAGISCTRQTPSQTNNAGIVCTRQTPSQAGWVIYWQSNTNKIVFSSETAGSIIQSVTTSDDWNHVAIVRYGNTVTLYIGGVRKGILDATGDSIDSCGDGLVIGRYYVNYSDYYFKGWIDELRISKGIARWTTNFTPPTEPYISDSYTKLLMHFEGAESKTLVAWPHGVRWGSTDYIIACAYGTKWELFCWSTSDEGDTVSPYGHFLVEPSGTGWRQNNIRRSLFYRDINDPNPNKRWKFYIMGEDASGYIREGYFYSSDPTSSGAWNLREYGINPILDTGVADFVFANPCRLYLGNGSWFTNDNGDWVTWNYHSSGVTLHNHTKTVDITSNVAEGDDHVHVASGHETHAGSVGDIVVIYDDDSNSSRRYKADVNRIRSTSTSGQIDLERPVNRSFNTAYSPKVRRYDYLPETGGDIDIMNYAIEPDRYGFGVSFGQFADFTYEPACEMEAYFESSDDYSWAVNYTKSLVIPMAPLSTTLDAYMSVSAENLVVIEFPTATNYFTIDNTSSMRAKIIITIAAAVALASVIVNIV